MKLFSFRICAISTFIFERRHVDATVLRPAGVADARQHIGDRIGHAHEMIFLSYPYRESAVSVGTRVEVTDGYQLALRTPGIIPDSASSRKQIRQSAELSQERARSAAPAAAVVLPHLELRLPLALLHHGLTRH